MDLTTEEILINKTFLIINAIMFITLEEQKETATPQEIYDYLLEKNIMEISLNDIVSILETINKHSGSRYFYHYVELINGRYNEKGNIEHEGKIITGYGLLLLHKFIPHPSY